MSEQPPDGAPALPVGGKGAAAARIALNALSGAIPLAGGLLSAFASTWSEWEEAKINEFLHHMMEMLNAEMREKEKTILEITARIDMQDERYRSASRAQLTKLFCEKRSAIGRVQRAKTSEPSYGTSLPTPPPQQLQAMT